MKINEKGFDHKNRPVESASLIVVVACVSAACAVSVATLSPDLGEVGGKPELAACLEDISA